MRAATDVAGLFQGEVLMPPNLILGSGLQVGWRAIPKRDGVNSEDHAFFSVDESIGIKQGLFNVYFGVGFRSNLTDANKPPVLGSEEVPKGMVYPRIGFDMAF